MANIRRLEFYDLGKLRKMISYLTEDVQQHLQFEHIPFPLDFFHNLLPVSLKWASESYIAQKDNEIKAMISLKPQKGNYSKWRITKLILNKNSYEEGIQLVDFVVAKYGAKGVNNFSVKIDESHDELLNLFSKNCGFRACANEQLWKMNDANFSDLHYNDCSFRPFKFSDTKIISKLYNDAIFPHFRFSISKTKDEFSPELFSGLAKYYDLKYIIQNKDNTEAIGYIAIETQDNMNYIVEITLGMAFGEFYQTALDFAIEQISNRKNNFFVFVKNKKYQMNSQIYEKYLNDNNFKQIQNRILLVKDFFRTIKTEEKITKPAIIFSEINTKPAFKI